MALTTTTANYTARILAAELPTVFFTTGTWTATRGSAGIYYMLHTDGDETSTIEVPITRVVSRYFRNTSDVGAPNPSRGLRLMSVTYDYAIGTADMDAHSADIVRVRYNAAAAPTVTTGVSALTTALATTFGTVTTTGLYQTTQTLDTPVFINPVQADETLFYVVTANNAATTVYRSHAFSFNFQIIQ